VAEWPSGFFCFWTVGVFGCRLTCVVHENGVKTPIVSGVPILYTTATEHHMTLLNKVFTTGTLVKIILVLTAVVAMKALSLHYDFSWATALAAE
jgi:hypothetical protein